MTPSIDLTNFVAGWESCSLAPYLDPVGLVTIGYGHRIPVGGDRSPITQDQANALLAQDLTNTMRGLSLYVSTDWNQQQADALTSLAFNCGVPAIAHSHLMALFNWPDLEGASEQFLVWDHTNGHVVPGLLKRRYAEQAIFLNADYSDRP
jgi:lysozyme